MHLNNILKDKKRYIQICIISAAGLIAYGMRTNLSVAIVAMMSKDPPDPSIPTYPDWDNKDILLSSFFWGYIVFQIVAGQIAERYGPKWFLIVSMTITSIFSIVIPPMAARFGSHGVMACRILQGLSQGFLFPSTHNIISKWTPLSERSRIAGFAYTAGPFGTFISMLVTGAISNSKVGWPVAFYLYGAIGFAWVALFAWLGCNCPEEHPTITPEERKYIEFESDLSKEKKNFSTPWLSIVSSMQVWAIAMAHIGNNWGFYTLMTEMPSYMNHILKYDIGSNSLLSALPYLAYTILSFAVGSSSDYVIKRNILTLGNSRKLFNSLGFFLPALALIILSFIPSQSDVGAVALFIIAVGTNSAILCGFNINHIDISPNFSGTLMGITNMISNVGSLIAPLVVQYVVTNQDDVSLWRIIFLLAAGIYLVTGMFFNIFGSGVVQEWNTPKKKTQDLNLKEKEVYGSV